MSILYDLGNQTFSILPLISLKENA